MENISIYADISETHYPHNTQLHAQLQYKHYMQRTALKMAMAIDDDGPISFEIDSASANNKNLIECQHQLRQELSTQFSFLGILQEILRVLFIK